MKWHVRAFIDNPGMAYDPAPLHEYDDETEGFIPAVGDILWEDRGKPAHKVVARHFDYSGKRCALQVEVCEDASPRWLF
ncbi:hypothetical protein [uncultured Algimonas sp.]|uniref:hypothetical protein n=1 Tax=uncultured Algimonas sp. TaxID=1547920 RepID=UPI00262AADB9|nr:hypothetical protein [uncultured Algimonas sp.]